MSSQPAAEVIALPPLGVALEAPPAALDPVLDAVATCLARHGLRRTSVGDVARELGVAPSTVYRKVGSLERGAWLLAAREAHRFLARIPEVVAGKEGPETVTAVVTAAIGDALDQPVFTKLLRDEPEFVGRSLTRDADAVVGWLVALLTPFLAASMDLGLVRRTDPARLAHWLTIVSIGVVLMPPADDLDTYIDELLLPALRP